MYTTEQHDGFWYVSCDGKLVDGYFTGHMPRSQSECLDAAQRLNSGATLRDLPAYGRQDMNRIVARAPWGDVYTAEDAENGCIPSEAYFVEDGQ